MKISYQLKILLLIISCIFMRSVYADDLGRIFTTPEQRQKLEKIRHTREAPKIIKVEEVKKIEEPVSIKKEIVVRDPITLKGLVHRSDGKSAAWINDSNTFDGNMDSELIEIPNDKIKSDQVTVVMPDDNSQVELKVGEVFTPAPLERDITDTITTQESR